MPGTEGSLCGSWSWCAPVLERGILGFENDYSMAGDEGEVSYEILDIFSSRSRNEDQPYFSGSPPTRSDNPLVHDVQFIRKGVPASPTIVSQKSSCGSSFGGKPLVRVEGFASSSPESHCRVSALA